MLERICWVFWGSILRVCRGMCRRFVRTSLRVLLEAFFLAPIHYCQLSLIIKNYSKPDVLAFLVGLLAFLGKHVGQSMSSFDCFEHVGKLSDCFELLTILGACWDRFEHKRDFVWNC